MTVYYVDADELEDVARAMRSMREGLQGAMWPLEFGAGAVPWRADTQKLWSDARHIIKFEYGWLHNDANALRDRARRAREEALRESILSGAPWFIAWAAWNNAKVAEVGIDPRKDGGKSSASSGDLPAAAQSAFAGATAAALAAATQAFVRTYKGQNGVDDGNGSYPGQCVSLVKRYAREVLGVSLGSFRSAGKDAQGNRLSGGPKPEWASPQAFKPETWQQIQRSEAASSGGFKVGDIMFLTGDATYGHIGIVTAVSANGAITVLDQNLGRNPDVSTISLHPTDSTILGVMRKK